MFTAIKLLFANRDANPFLVIGCLLLSSVAETIGLGTLLPVISIAAGGTGGHIFPGIAIAEELRVLDPATRIVFAGTERGLETRILPRLNWPLKLFPSHSIKDQRGIMRVVAWPIAMSRSAE